MNVIRARRHVAPLVLAVLLTLILQAVAQSPTPHRHKVQVSDPADRKQITDAGGRLIADYGSYQLYEIDQPSTPLAGRRAPENRDEYNYIRLNAATLDTTAPETTALRQAVGDFKGRRMHLVQFAGPTLPAWFEELRKTGVKVVDYIPNNSYLVYGDAASLARLQTWATSSASVQWEAPYQPAHRIHPNARKTDAKGRPHDIGTDYFTIQLEEDADTNPATLAVIDRLKLEPNSQPSHILHFVNVTAKLDPASLDTIAAQPDVVSIQPHFDSQLFCERQAQIVAGNLSGNVPTGPGYLAWLTSKGFTQAQFDASGFAVDVSDSGIDNGTTSPNHFGLYVSGTLPGTSRVIYNRLVGTPNSGSTLQGCDGHGNLNSHIIGGYDDLSGFPFADSSGFHYGLGICPFVRVGSSVIFDPSSFTSPNYASLQSQAYHDGARVSNNSWGNTTGNTYTTDSQTYDALVRDAQPTGSTFPVAGNQEMVIVFAAGNSGSAANTVHAPATAKNVFVIGAGENVQPFGGSDGSGVTDAQADSANDIVSFSSRGPCSDGRKKPDICAPGTHVSGGVAQASNPGTLGTANSCFTGSGVSGGVGSSYFPAGQQFYTASSGTSHSTPGVVGGCALLRQYFINQGFTPPSPAMTKAYLMNSAAYMTGTGANDTLPSNNQGMGRMNLGMAFDSAARVLRDELAGDMFTASGQSRVITGTIDSAGSPFRITLAWTDAPGPTSGSAWVNNLDLTVTVGGNTYKGNVFSGANSITGGSADVANNVESVFLPAGVSGQFIVTITATGISGDGVPNVGGSLDQDFALVIYNGVTVVTPQVALNVNKTGAGTGTITSLPASINCGVTCNSLFDTNGVVNLTATAGPNSAFTGWSGDASGTANPIPVTMDVAKTVTANFNGLPSVITNGVALTVEGCAPGNGVVDPNEQVTVNFGLKNVGLGDASNVVATLQATGGITSPSGSQSFGTLLPGGSAAMPFTFTATGSCGGTVTVTLQIQTNLTTYGTATYVLNLGSLSTSFSENFDGVTKPALPAGWTTTAGGGQSAWITTNVTVDTAPNAAFSRDPATVGSNALVSPVLPIASASAKLTFRNNYSLEASSTVTVGYDGGVLEIKLGAGAFQDILAAGGSFASGGYTRTISSSFSNPLAGRQAWSGSSGGYITTLVNLPAAAAGQNIQLRWRCGTDSSVSSTGWRIDTISISDALCCTGTVNNPPVINSALVTPVNPTTTNDLLATVTSATDADGDPITFVYQWQESTNNTTFGDLGGQTSSNLLAAITVAGDYYRVVITPNDGITNGAPFTTASVLVPVDADGNGINDDWEVQYFGHIGVDPNADPDGDGFSNLQEFLAGTDPTNSASAFRITSVAPEGNDLHVTWMTGVGKTNALQFTTGDADGSFTNDFTDLFSVTNTIGSTTNYLDIGAFTNSPARYYRIRLVP